VFYIRTDLSSPLRNLSYRVAPSVGYQNYVSAYRIWLLVEINRRKKHTKQPNSGLFNVSYLKLLVGVGKRERERVFVAYSGHVSWFC